MAGLQLQPLPSAGSRIVDAQGGMDPVFRIALQAILDQIVDAVNAVAAAQAAADAAQTAADAADTAAATAQAAAEAAQDAVDAIVVPPTGTRSVSTTQALTADDFAILADASGGAITLTLPSAASAQNAIVITKTDASANAVNLAPFGSDQLNGGGAPVPITLQNAARTFTSDGTSEWYG